MFLSAVRRSLFSASVSTTKSFLLKALKKDAIRTFATASTKRSNLNPTKELIKTLESELNDQMETIKEEEMTPSSVLENFSEFIEQGQWKIEHPKDTLMVTLRRRDEKLQADVAIKFDLLEVYNELYNNPESELMNQEEESEESGRRGYENDQINNSNEKIDEIDEFDYASLPISVEIKRDSVNGKQLNFECILEGDEEQSDFIIESVSVADNSNASSNVNVNTYTAPNFSQLDESLQENFQEFLTGMLGSNQEELMAFIKEYSLAQEAGMYQKWLGEVRDILKH